MQLGSQNFTKHEIEMLKKNSVIVRYRVSFIKLCGTSGINSHLELTAPDLFPAPASLTTLIVGTSIADDLDDRLVNVIVISSIYLNGLTHSI